MDWKNIMALGSLALSGCVAPTPPGTPMSSTCAEVPTVEECRAGADVITDERLWSCVKSQCTRIEVRCGVEIRKECRKRSVEAGGTIMGYALQKQGLTYVYSPVKEVYWCEESSGEDCRVKAMIHELAHSCGWEHKEGMGVPANEGDVKCE
jgi:hypothetical protein